MKEHSQGNQNPNEAKKSEKLTPAESAVLAFLKKEIDSDSNVDLYFEAKNLKRKIGEIASFSDQDVLKILAKIKKQFKPSVSFDTGYLHPYDGGGVYVKITSK